MQRRVVSSQNVSRMCMVCGRDNPLGLQGRFYELDDGELLGVFTPREEHQGYPGRLHGGISSAMLDETIGRAVTIARPDAWGVTVELTVKYRRPVPLDEEIRVVGRITRDTTRLFEGSGELLLADGSVAVEARGRYLRLPLDAIADEAFAATDWFADERRAPESVDL